MESGEGGWEEGSGLSACNNAAIQEAVGKEWMDGKYVDIESVH